MSMTGDHLLRAGTNGGKGNQLPPEYFSADNKSPRAIFVPPSGNYSLEVIGKDFGTSNIALARVVPGSTSAKALQTCPSGLICIFITEGSATCVDGSGNVLTVSAGSCWVYGGASDVRITWEQDCQGITAIVPHQVVRDFGLMPPTAFKALPVGSSLLEPARNFMHSVVTSTAQISSVAAYFFEKLIHEMIGGLFLEDSGVVAGGSKRPTLYHQARALITASAGDPALTSASLARDLNVSLRHLQREFQKRNESVAEAIRQCRVDLAVRLLTDPAFTVLSLDQVAAQSGFSSLGHLRRTLQATGAGTPRDIRAFGKNQPELATTEPMDATMMPPTA